MNRTIRQYTTKSRTFKMAPDQRFLTCYINGRVSGFIWNTNTKIMIDGKEITSSEFFK